MYELLHGTRLDVSVWLHICSNLDDPTVVLGISVMVIQEPLLEECMHHSQAIQFCLPGPEFLFERLADISAESDFLRYVDEKLRYAPVWEDGPELFANFVKENGLLEAAAQFLPKDEWIESTVVGALKYPFVFDRILSGLSGDDDANVLGIPYAFEACDDIRCALKLLAGGYFKQALQILRGALELSVCHAYFSAAGLGYDDLESTSIPPMRDKRLGMINRLIACRRIERDLAQGLASVYNELSLATHAHYRYLNLKFEKVDEAGRFLHALESLCAVSRLCTSTVLSMKSISMYTGTPLS